MTPPPGEIHKKPIQPAPAQSPSSSGCRLKTYSSRQNTSALRNPKPARRTSNPSKESSELQWIVAITIVGRSRSVAGPDGGNPPTLRHSLATSTALAVGYPRPAADAIRRSRSLPAVAAGKALFRGQFLLGRRSRHSQSRSPAHPINPCAPFEPRQRHHPKHQSCDSGSVLRPKDLGGPT